MKSIDITGQKFGRLTAIRFDHISNSGGYFWLFKCDCGKLVIKGKYEVKSGNTKSCGCYRKEIKSAFKHGLSNSRFFRIFSNINTRCLNKNCRYYLLYGGRGIKNLWLSVIYFKNDMYKSYLEHCKKFGVENTTIDRIDNNRHYCKENCRWATWKEQQRNKRNNHVILFNGQSLSIAEWSDKTGIPSSRIQTRLNQLHWSTEKTLTTPRMLNQFAFSKD